MGDLKQGTISWEDAAAVCEDYAEVLEREELGHELCVDEHGTIRWVANPEKEQEIMDEFGAVDLNHLFMKGANKNDPRIRELYKHIGYSLYGFWEVFYWEANNERAWEYQGRGARRDTKRLKYEIVVEVKDDTDAEEFGHYFKEQLTDIAIADWDEDEMWYRIVLVEEE